jgi:hypothetical protein
MKRILIATPSLNQQIDAYYVHSLCESIKLGLKHNLDISATFLANESILPMARNELLALAYKQNYDTTVFIDSDELWQPQCLIDIILSPKDVISVPVVNKSDKKIQYNVVLETPKYQDNQDGYIKLKSTGTGFLKLSQKVVTDLYESNITLEFRGKQLKNICEYTYQNGSFVGEDITLSRKIRELGYTIWCNPHYTIKHIGTKIYSGSFAI